MRSQLRGGRGLSVAQQIETCGLTLKGIIGLDCRCVPRMLLATATDFVPRTLSQSVTTQHFRLVIDQFHFTAQLGLKGCFSALERDFCKSDELGANSVLSLPSVHFCQNELVGSNHFQLEMTHEWDISCLLATCKRQCSRRRLRRPKGTCSSD